MFDAHPRVVGSLRLTCRGLLLASTLALLVPRVASGRAAQATVTTFYAATVAAYDAWNATTSTARPPRTDTFAPGTHTIAVYFEYAGTTANSTTFTILVKSATGVTAATHGPFTLSLGAGLHMSKITAATAAPFASGAYGADLEIGDRVVAHTTFRVAAAATVVIPTFYSTTKAAFDTWSASSSTAAPTHTAQFATGTATIAFYWEYDHTVARVTQYLVHVYAASGALVGSIGPGTFSYSDGYLMRTLNGINGHPFTGGVYTADLQVDGVSLRQTTFTIVGRAAVRVPTFYSITRAAFDAWDPNAATPTVPARTALFGLQSHSIAFYFAYNGAAAHDQYHIVVYNGQGQIVTHSRNHTFDQNDGLAMVAVSPLSTADYPPGPYRADFITGGQVTARAFFRVGTPLAPPVCRAADTLATCIEPSVLRLHANLSGNSEAEGTGWVVRSDASGTWLVTNKHVVTGATPRTMTAITPSGATTYPVLAIRTNSSDEGTAGDLALIKLPPTGLRPLHWGDSESLHLLQPVVSIGYGDAFELPGPPTVTQGSISALHRDMGDGFGGVWIQHQSFINHGNSGGPLLDASYAVVGVNTLSLKDTQGIFLAIPANLASHVIATLMQQMGDA